MFNFIRRHRWMTLFVGTGFTCMSCPVLILIAPINARVSSKAGAWHSSTMPTARTGDGQPILQLESHTCGLLSLSAAYVLYGLSPEDKNLRYRLGVDVPANPLDPDSKGTLQPDMLRVLVQDGFAYEMPSPLSGGRERLVGHLEADDVALLLIRRRETGGLHWVLADGYQDHLLSIVDSLAVRPGRENIDEYFNECILSMILIRPAAGPALDVRQAHRDGMAEMLRVNERLDVLQSRQSEYRN